MRTVMTVLTLFAFVMVAGPVRAEFYGMSDYDVLYTKDTGASPPQYWLEGFTFVDHNIPLEDIVVGETTGVENVGGGDGIASIDDLDLNSFAPRNGANPPELTTVNFGGSATWQDTNGADKYDFFVFEAGRNDQFAVQAILVGGVLGEKVVVPKSQWEPSIAGEPKLDLQRNPGPNNNQDIGGIAFKITDLKDENGSLLSNDAVIEGLVFTSPGMDPSCICAVKGSPGAFGPSPADGSSIGDACPVLTWSEGAGAVSEKVYLSSDPAEVEAMSESALLAEGGNDFAIVCGSALFPDQLESGVYYWRIVTTNDQGSVHAGQIWSFEVMPRSAHEPNPVDGAVFVATDAELNWSAGLGAIVHYVYFGTDADAVANATEGGELAADPTFEPDGALENGTTYYWRVDEFDGEQLVTGEVWSFTVVPAGTGGLKAEYFSGVGDLTGAPTVSRVDSQIDFDWGTEPPDGAVDRLSFSARWNGEVMIPVDGTYTFIVNSNDGVRLYVDDQLVVEDWGTHTARDRSGELTLEAGDYPIAVEYFQAGGGASLSLSWESDLISRQVIPSVALSPTVRARLIWPTKDATDVSQNPRLRWGPASAEAQHDVYFGDDAGAVAQATTGTAGIYKGRLDADVTDMLMTGLEPGKAYYWRVDEIIAGDPLSPMKGNVWGFTTADFLVIDDFENYDNYEPKRVFETWLDGWDVAANGSTMGYPEPNFAAGESFVETDIVRNGRQAAPLFFENTGQASYSEATMTLTTNRDWTAAGVKSLSIAYHGVGPAGSFAYDADKDAYTIAATGNGVDGSSDGFRFAYKMLTGDGEIKARVDSLENVSGWAVSGVMIRNTLDSGSVFAMSGVRATGQAFLRWRDLAGSDLAGTEEEPPFPATIVMPHWVRVTRQGNTFTAFHSSDNSTWEPIGDPVTVPMNQQVYVGLAVSADVGFNDSTTTTSVLSSPSVTGAVDAAGPFDTYMDIGMAMNPDENLYLEVRDSGNGVATIPHPDNPNAIQDNAWKEWNLELTEISGQGVNLSDIASVTLGIGSKPGTPSGEDGVVYFDDIRLYPPRCLPELPKPAADLNSNCVVDLADVEVMGQQWLQSGADLSADLDASETVDLGDFAVLADTWLDAILWP